MEKNLEEDQILMHVGILLMNVQMFEYLLVQAIKTVYAEEAELTVDKILAEDKKTLGRLIEDLKKRTVLDSDLDELLVNLLRDRNLFVHNMRFQEWFDTSTDEGRIRVIRFLNSFSQNLNHAIRIFVAVHDNHCKEIGFDSPKVSAVRNLAGFRISEYAEYAKNIKRRE